MILYCRLLLTNRHEQNRYFIYTFNYTVIYFIKQLDFIQLQYAILNCTKPVWSTVELQILEIAL